MKIRRILSFLMIAALVLCSFTVSSYAAADSWKPKNEEPFVFVHGLNGWGGAEGINGVVPDCLYRDDRRDAAHGTEHANFMHSLSVQLLTTVLRIPQSIIICVLAEHIIQRLCLIGATLMKTEKSFFHHRGDYQSRISICTMWHRQARANLQLQGVM